MPRGERGTATVLVSVLVALLLQVTVLAVVVGALYVGQRRAAAAADLAALAGASALQAGSDGCAAAHDVARHNAAVLAACASEGEVVTVEVALEVPGLLGAVHRVGARARAGPVA